MWAPTQGEYRRLWRAFVRLIRRLHHERGGRRRAVEVSRLDPVGGNFGRRPMRKLPDIDAGVQRLRGVLPGDKVK